MRVCENKISCYCRYLQPPMKCVKNQNFNLAQASSPVNQQTLSMNNGLILSNKLKINGDAPARLEVRMPLEGALNSA